MGRLRPFSPLLRPFSHHLQDTELCHISTAVRLTSTRSGHNMLIVAWIFSMCTMVLHLALQWHHNEHDGVSNHRHLDCLLNRMRRRRLKKTSKLCATDLCERNSPVTSEIPTHRASNVEKFPLDDVMMVFSDMNELWGLLFSECLVVNTVIKPLLYKIFDIDLCVPCVYFMKLKWTYGLQHQPYNYMLLCKMFMPLKC